MWKLNNGLHRVSSLVLHSMADGDDGAGGADGKGDQIITVKVGDEEKQFSASDVSNLLAQQAEATKRSQQVAPLLDMAARYGVSVEDLAHNAEGSFGLMSKLIDEGIINEKGEVLKKVPAKQANDDPIFRTDEDQNVGGDKKFRVAAQAMLDPFEDRLGKLEEMNDRLRTDNTNLMRLRISDKLETAFPDFTERDIAAVFSRAEKNRDKTILEHAEDIKKAKEADVSAQEAAFVKKYGIDIEKAKENQMFEQDPTGAAAAVVADKKISFKGGKDAVTPAQASKNFLSKFQGFRP